MHMIYPHASTHFVAGVTHLGVVQCDADVVGADDDLLVPLLLQDETIHLSWQSQCRRSSREQALLLSAAKETCHESDVNIVAQWLLSNLFEVHTIVPLISYR